MYLSGNKCQQHRSGPFHLTATLHPAPLLCRWGKLTPFYPLWSKVRTQSDIPQKYFKDQRRKCGDLLEKTCPAPPNPPPLHHHPAENHIYGLRWWWVVPWILSEMASHNENFCEIFVPAAGLFLVIKHKFKLQQFEFVRLVISKKSLQSSQSTLFASQMFPYDRSSIFWLHLERTRHDPGDCKGTGLRFQLRGDDSRLLNL